MSWLKRFRAWRCSRGKHRYVIAPLPTDRDELWKEIMFYPFTHKVRCCHCGKTARMID